MNTSSCERVSSPLQFQYASSFEMLCASMKSLRAIRMYQISKPTTEMSERKTPIAGTKNPTVSTFATIPTYSVTFPKIVLRSIDLSRVKSILWTSRTHHKGEPPAHRVITNEQEVQVSVSDRGLYICGSRASGCASPNPEYTLDEEMRYLSSWC